MKKSANVRVLFGLIVTWAILGNHGLVECKFNAKKIFEKFDNVFNKKIANLKFSFDDCGNCLFILEKKIFFDNF